MRLRIKNIGNHNNGQKQGDLANDEYIVIMPREQKCACEGISTIMRCIFTSADASLRLQEKRKIMIKKYIIFG
ncbi:MAG TPA: hypothetical protein ENN39_01015 [Desulfonatronum sp.]|nr:hypothetical protein [Desulfonatronum sp.]